MTITIAPPIRTPEQILSEFEFHLDDFIGVGELDPEAGVELLSESGEVFEALAAGDQQAALNQAVELAGKKIDEVVKDEKLSLAAANQLYRFLHDLLRSLGAFMPANLLDLRIAINDFVAFGDLDANLAKLLRNDVAKIMRHLAKGNFDQALEALRQWLKTLRDALKRGQATQASFGGCPESR